MHSHSYVLHGEVLYGWIMLMSALAIDLGMGWHQLRVVTTDPHPPNRARTMFIVRIS